MGEALTEAQRSALARISDGRAYTLDEMPGSVRAALYRRGLIESVSNSVTRQYFLRITEAGRAVVRPDDTP